MRRLVGRAFYWSPERLGRLVQETLDQLLSPHLQAGHLEVIADLAAPLPVMVIARMLGVPARDCLLLKPWADELSHILDPLMPLETYAHLNRMMEQFTTYFQDLVNERQKRPQDDAISALLSADDPELNLTDLMAICIVLFMTGEETTVNTIGNGLLALLQHPDQLQILRQTPDLIPAALDELLRFESPLQLTARVATCPVELRQKTIEPGQTVFLSLGAANRDPAQFPDPDRLDVQRIATSHLAFGDGIHYCLGAGLARIQGHLALQRLLALPDLQLGSNTWQWRKNIALRGVQSLPITFLPHS
ncbi:MAG: cytochrome P450 [Synechococcaceae cyanobacterium SM2_3_1]|nr:cytochrome P450 [Synechococcaceae cyanobacterium SM2_3_1]